MKILLVAIYLLFSVVQSVSADTRSTNVSWTNSSGISECGQVTSHGVNHHGVPNSNSNSVATSGNRTCVAHSYFTGQDVTYPTSGYYNRSSVQGCPSQMRAIRIEYYNGTTLVTTRNIGSNVYAGNNWNRYRLICRSWDDTAPLVSATNSSNTWSNTNISITLNASDRGVNGSNSNGSLVQARYSWSNNLNATCTSGGSTYSNGQTITQSNNGNHTLYLCARDRAGNVGTWSGTYRLDKIPPTGTLTYHDGWTNNTNQIINFTYNDTGGSGFRNYTLQRRINDTSPSFPNGSWGGWSNVSGCVNQTSGTSCLAGTLSNHRAYQYRIIIRDNAGNEATVTSPRTLQIDTTTPTIADISNSNPENLLANSSYTYQFSVGNNSGAPIVSVSGVRERHGSEDINLSFSCTSSNCSVPWNISRVDNFRLANGSRQYTFRITEMCDEAGNCSDETRNYNHNVYPDTVSTITSELIGEELSDSTNIARGNARNVRLRLRDQYNNAIIPASGIGRTISFRINSDNQLRLNQYNNNGNDSALFASNITTEIPTGTNQVLTLNNQTSTNGNYTIPFYIFAPTSNTDSLVPGEANINNIQFAINSLIEVVSGDSPQFQYTNGEGVVIQQNFIPNTNLVVRASPLFSTNFTGEIINNGFIEGADQSSEITVTRHHSTSITSPSLRLEFGEVDGDNSNVENERFNIRVNNQFLSEGNQSNWNSISQVWNNLNPTTRDITSRMIQEAGSAPRDTQSYLASIIKYNISGKNVIYPSAIIGKDAYYGIQADGDTFQRGVRIIGLTSSQRTEELTSGQFTNDARILGQITKAELRRDMQRNVSQITRNIEATPQGTSGTPRVTLQTSGNGWGSLSSGGGLILSQGDILYFKNPTTGIVRISGEVSGQKTLIVENGNVYIDGNITGNGTLGIVVLREDNAGGNVYIDPSVTDIHASMFVDRSIISYDGVELDGNTSANILRHQLYIYGSVFSENTIGTSRSADVLCPFYVPTSSCNQVTAQKYDFNYLRRYFINRNGDASGSESSKRSSADISLRDYPVIIEYNSNIQTSPPPLFDIQQ